MNCWVIKSVWTTTVVVNFFRKNNSVNCGFRPMFISQLFSDDTREIVYNHSRHIIIGSLLRYPS